MHINLCREQYHQTKIYLADNAKLLSMHIYQCVSFKKNAISLPSNIQQPTLKHLQIYNNKAKRKRYIPKITLQHIKIPRKEYFFDKKQG